MNTSTAPFSGGQRSTRKHRRADPAVCSPSSVRGYHEMVRRSSTDLTPGADQAAVSTAYLSCQLSTFPWLVTAALAKFTPREQRILRMRFGIGDAGEHTLEEVGKVFGVTRERIPRF